MKLAVAQIRARLGADVYLASVAKSAAGVAQAYGHNPLIAQKHHVMIVMANCLGPCDDFIGAGRSAVWNLQVNLLASSTIPL